MSHPNPNADIENLKDADEICEHDEHEHYICIDCGAELDPGYLIDLAMSALEDR